MGADDPEDSTLLFYDNSKRQTSEYEIVKYLRTDGQAVEVVVVRKKQTIVQRAAGYWPISQTQKVQEFVRKTYLLGDASTGRNLGIQRHLQREYDILRTIEHPYIVRLTDFEIISTPSEGTKAYLYTLYCSHGDLTPYVGAGQIWDTRLRPTLSTSQFWQIFRQLSSALLYCQYGISTWQEKGLIMDPNWTGAIFHRDIKPANVVISELTDQEIKVKLCDFGYSRFVSSKVSGSFVGTHGYIAPEITEYSQNWTEKCDIYSLGRTMFALLLYLPISEEEKKKIRLKFEDCFHAKPESRPKILPLFEITTAEVYKKESFHVDVSEYLQADKLPLLASLHQAGMRWGRKLFRDNENHEHLRLLRVLFRDSIRPPTTRSDHLRQIRQLLLQGIFTCASMRYKGSQGKSKAVQISPKIQSHRVTDVDDIFNILHLTFDHPPQDYSKDGLREEIDALLEQEKQTRTDELLRATQVVSETQSVSNDPSSLESPAAAEIPAVPELHVVPTNQPDEHSQTKLAPSPEPQDENQPSQEIQVNPKTLPTKNVQTDDSANSKESKGQPSQDSQVIPKTQSTSYFQTSTPSDSLGGSIQPSEEAQVNSKTQPTTNIQANASAKTKGGKVQPSQEVQVNPKTQPKIDTKGYTSAMGVKVHPRPSPKAHLRSKDRRRDSSRPRPESRVLVSARSEAQIRPRSIPIAPFSLSFLSDGSNHQVPLVSSYSMLETPIRREASIEQQQRPYPSNTGTYGSTGQGERLVIHDIPRSRENRGYSITDSAEQSRTNERRERRPSITDTPSRRERRGRIIYSPERRRPIITGTSSRGDERDRRLQDGTYGTTAPSSRDYERDLRIQELRLQEELRQQKELQLQYKPRLQELRLQDGAYGIGTTAPSSRGNERDRRMQELQLQDGTYGTVPRPSYGLPESNSGTSQLPQMYQSPHQVSGDWQPHVPDPLSQRRDKHRQQGRATEALRSYQPDNLLQSRNQAQESEYYGNRGLSLRNSMSLGPPRDIRFPFLSPESEASQAVDPIGQKHKLSSVDVFNRTVDEIAASRVRDGNEEAGNRHRTLDEIAASRLRDGKGEPGNHLPNYTGYTLRQLRNEELGTHLPVYSERVLKQNHPLSRYSPEILSENYQIDDRGRTSVDPPISYLQEEFAGILQVDDRGHIQNQNTDDRSRVDYGSYGPPRPYYQDDIDLDLAPREAAMAQRRRESRADRRRH